MEGGGTDLSPYVDEHGGQVLNATISLYAYTTLVQTDSVVRFRSEDQSLETEFPADQPAPADTALRLHAGVHNRFVRDHNGGRPLPVAVTTFCDAPMGSGLGASSTIVVSMIAAYARYLKIHMSEYDMARLAFEIERRDLKLQGGRQDQYAATFGGFNFMEFLPGDRAIVTPLRIKDWIRSEIEASLVLYYTDTSRESAHIISEQIAHMIEHDAQTIARFNVLKQHAALLKERLLKGSLASFAEVLGQSWDEKRKTAKSISNSEIDRVYEAALAAGAIGGKISGAGGGGFMMLMCDPVKRQSVVAALRDFGGTVMACHFVNEGAAAWSVPDRAEVDENCRIISPSLLVRTPVTFS